MGAQHFDVPPSLRVLRFPTMGCGDAGLLAAVAALPATRIETICAGGTDRVSKRGLVETASLGFFSKCDELQLLLHSAQSSSQLKNLRKTLVVSSHRNTQS